MPGSPPVESDLPTTILWSAGLIVLIVILFWVVSRVRKWLAEDAAPAPGAGFTLSDLRALRKAGKMSDEEFEKAKNILVAAAHKPAVDPIANRKSTGDPQL